MKGCMKREHGKARERENNGHRSDEMSDLLFGDFGVLIIEMLQAFSPKLDLPFQMISFLGDETAFILGIAVIAWCFRKRLGIEMLYLVAFAGSLNTLVKGFFGFPRPFQSYPNRILQLDSIGGYSYPSGHSQLCATFYGYLGYTFRNVNRGVLYATFSASLVLLIMTSRIYLGAHYLSDVLMGALLGIMTLAVYVLLRLRIEEFVQTQRDLKIASLAFLGSFSIVAISTVSTVMTHHSLEMAGNGSMPGVICGATAGLLLERKRIGFTTEGISNLVRMIRMVVGLLVVATVYVGSAILFEPFEVGFSSIVADFLRYFGITFAATYVAPYLFSRIESKATRRDGGADFIVENRLKD